MRWLVNEEYDPKVDIVDQLLEIRGIKTQKEKKEFLESGRISEIPKKLPADFKKTLVKAKKVILEAIKNDNPIVVFGDYDADGVCATAILYSTIKNELGYENVTYFIPNRFDHGYGMSLDSLEAVLGDFEGAKADKKGNKKGDGAEEILFITVDTGITAADEIAFLKEKGHKILLTDHHQKPENVPKADCILWHDEVVGASVSWFLSKVLGSKSLSNVAYAAIATITDLQPVMGVNRVIVKRGLEVINNEPPVGIKSLLEIAGKSVGDIRTYDLGWVIGPRLNASGRLKDAGDSVKLLLADNESKAREIAGKLDSINSSRQDKTMEMYEMASMDDKDKLPPVIFSSNENYHEGIIGLVAAKLVQKYHRPSIVISLDDDFGKGSVRSIPGVNIIEMLRKFEELFENVGGHPMAAGFTIKKENIPELQEKMISLAKKEIDEELFVPILNVDMKIPVDLVSMDLVAKLEKMKPFGLGNEEPVFVSEDLGITDVSVIGREKTHLLLKFFSGGDHYKGVFFGGAGRADELGLGDKVDVVFNVRRNDFNGRTYVDLIVKDLKK